MGDTIKFLCVDDYPGAAAIYSMVLGFEPGMECVGCLYDANELTNEVASLRPDVVLLDLSMPGKNAIEAIRELSAAQCPARVIVFTGNEDPAKISQTMSAGAHGYVVKTVANDVLIDAIRRVARGERVQIVRGRLDVD